MLTAERTKYIQSALQQNGSVRVDELASMFQVSEMTVRRDLEKLEKDGVLTRCRGGAISVNEMMSDPDFTLKSTQNHASKAKIAQYCYDNFVKENTVIYLDAGSTILEMAKLLVHRDDITIVTNDVLIASALLNSNANVFVLGGQMQKKTGCMHGHFAETQFDIYRINTAFVSGLCVDDSLNVFATTENKVFFRLKVLKQAAKSYMLMDQSKFHRQSLFRVNNLTDYDAVITDCPMPAKESNRILQSGLEWICVE